MWSVYINIILNTSLQKTGKKILSSFTKNITVPKTQRTLSQVNIINQTKSNRVKTWGPHTLLPQPIRTHQYSVSRHSCKWADALPMVICSRKGKKEKRMTMYPSFSGVDIKYKSSAHIVVLERYKAHTPHFPAPTQNTHF